MWLMTPLGFFSIVCKPDDEERGRRRRRPRRALSSKAARYALVHLSSHSRARRSGRSDSVRSTTAPTQIATSVSGGTLQPALI